MSDNVNHPSHYNSYKGLEIIDLTEQMNFNKGNGIKYIARAGLKNPDTEIEDLKKARWYIDREIQRLEKNQLPANIMNCSNCGKAWREESVDYILTNDGDRTCCYCGWVLFNINTIIAYVYRDSDGKEMIFSPKDIYTVRANDINKNNTKICPNFSCKRLFLVEGVDFNIHIVQNNEIFLCNGCGYRIDFKALGNAT